MIMTHSSYRYVDVAIGGATKRNNATALDKLHVDLNAENCYTTMFRFREEYKTHVDGTGSVRGADQFSCWSDYLWFDIDQDKLDDATIDLQKLLRGLQSMGVLDQVAVFFSGSKGYHVGINSGLFGFEPSQQLPEQMRVTALAIASLFHVEIDTKVYNHNRLWRIVDTLHAKTGLRKTALDTAEALTSDTATIQQLVASNDNRQLQPRYILCEVAEPNDVLVRLYREATSGKVEKDAGWDNPILSAQRIKEIEAGVQHLLAHGVLSGQRDNEALLRASEIRKLGQSQDECAALLMAWNKLNLPPLSDSDIDRIVQSAYTGAGYDFGTQNESLREAREQGKLTLHTETVNKQNQQDADYEPRPRTLRELMQMGEHKIEVERVGPWVSWRGRITLLVGREKRSGKSTLCASECAAVARNGGRVLWISAFDEARADVVQRFSMLLGDDAEAYDENIVIAADQDMPQTWETLVKYIDDENPDIVILDSIHSITPILERGRGRKGVPDTNEPAKWQEISGLLRPVAIKRNCALIWIHHANKDKNESQGSTGIAAGVDAVITMSYTYKPSNKVRSLTVAGRIGIGQYECSVRFQNDEDGYVTHHVATESTGTTTAEDESTGDRLVRVLYDMLDKHRDKEIPLEELKQEWARETNESWPNNAPSTINRKLTGDMIVKYRPAKSTQGLPHRWFVQSLQNATASPTDLLEDSNE